MKAAIFLCLAITGSQCGVQTLFHSASIPLDSGVVDTDLDGETDYAIIHPKDSIVIRFRESIDPASFDLENDIVPMPYLNIQGEFSTTLQENDTLVISPLGAFPQGLCFNLILKPNSIIPTDPESTLSLANGVSLHAKVRDEPDNTHPYIVRTDPEFEASNALCQGMKIEFSEEMESLRVYAKPGTPELPTDGIYDSSENPEYGVRFPSGLEPGTRYTIIIDPIGTKTHMGTADKAGNPLVDIAQSKTPRKVEWSFTTREICED